MSNKVEVIQHKNPSKVNNKNKNKGDVIGPIDLSNLLIRTCVFGGAVFLYCLLVSIHWEMTGENAGDSMDTATGDDKDHHEIREKGAYMYMTADIIMLLAILLSVFSAFKGNSKIGLISLILAAVSFVFWIIGFSCYWHGTLEMADGSWNTAEKLFKRYTAYYFAKDFIVFGVGVIVAWDTYKQGFLNGSKVRALAMCSVLLAVMGLIAAVSSAYLVQEMKDYNDRWNTDDQKDTEWTVICCGWFIVCLSAIMRCVMEFFGFENKLFGLVTAVFMVIGGLVIAGGYFAIADEEDGDDEDEKKCFHTGAGLFFWIVTWANALDMGIIKRIIG